MSKHIIFSLFLFLIFITKAEASYHFANFKAHPPIHYFGSIQSIPQGFSPDQIKNYYNLQKSGGHGTVAIIDAYDDPYVEKDLNTFSKTFNLPDCTVKNSCLEIHKMTNNIKANAGWKGETSLDIEWVHAIAPNAKILLVEATTPSGNNFIKAIDYAASRSDVVAVSMSWGGPEFPEEVSLDSHFKSKYGAIFFASAGDNGSDASWPAASPYVVGVGGTKINLASNGDFKNETAWSGSGGGVSQYEKAPIFQVSYIIPRSNNMRAIPDVSYDADPSSGFPVYISSSAKKGGWYIVGGTSAGAPQWAAIQSLGLSVSLQKLYSDKAAQNYSDYFRDIVSGTNGTCKYYCKASKHYDFVTGLGSPLTTKF